MANCSAILYTQPSEMDGWNLDTLYRWHEKALARSGDKNGD